MIAKDGLTEEELKKKAYLMGLRLKKEGLEADIIYARLEKQGIPEAMARQVVQNIVLENKREVRKETEPVYRFSLIILGAGILIALVSFIVIPQRPVLPISIIAGALVSAYIAKRKMDT